MYPRSCTCQVFVLLCFTPAVEFFSFFLIFELHVAVLSLTPDSAQESLVVGLRGLYEVPGIKPRLAVCKTSALPTAFHCELLSIHNLMYPHVN